MATDSLTPVNLFVQPPTQGAGEFSYSFIISAVALSVGSPILSKPNFASIFPRSLTVRSPIIGSPIINPSAIIFSPASIALGMLKRRHCLGTPRLTLNLSAPRQITALDRHVRRDGNAYTEAWSNLLPTGLAWPREPSTTMMKIVGSFAQVWGKWVDRRAADLLEQETDPRKTLEMLPDWERNWGLPEICFVEPLTIDERRRQLIFKMTLLGAQSRNFFYEVAMWERNRILIKEFAPFMVGISEVGDTRDDAGDYRWEIGPPEMRFYWTVHTGDPHLTWFRASAGQAGVDPHLRIGMADDLECLLERWKPAQTDIVLDYSGLAFSGPMAGTP